MLTLLELTNVCNLRCVGCGTWQNLHRKKGFFDLALLDQIFPSQYIHKVPLFWYGESYMHKQMYECVSEIKKRDKGAEVYASTNGMFLDERGVEKSLECGFDEIFIAIDGTTADVYESYRVGGDFDKVVDGSRRLIERKKKLGLSAPIITWQFIAFKSNEHQIEEAISMAREIGFDRFLLKTTANEALGSAKFKRVVKGDEQVYGDTLVFNRIALDPALDQKRKSTHEKWQDVVRAADLDTDKVKLGPPCYGPAILWDGVVIQCCWDAHAESYLGDIKEERFDNIIEGVHYKHFLRTLHNGRNAVCNSRHCSARPVVVDDGYKLPEEYSKYESRHGEHKTNLIAALGRKNDELINMGKEMRAQEQMLSRLNIAEMRTFSIGEDGTISDNIEGIQYPNDKALTGYLDRAMENDKFWLIKGWAADVGNGIPAEKVLIFAGGLCLNTSSPHKHRRDVVDHFGNEKLGVCGFEIEIPSWLTPDLDKVEIRAFALGKDGRVGELAYAPAFSQDIAEFRKKD